MLSRSSGRPNNASRGRTSFSNGGLFRDSHGVIHVRIPHANKGNAVAKSYRGNLVSLHCEKRGNFDRVGEVTAVPERLNAFPTCVRCIAMEPL